MIICEDVDTYRPIRMSDGAAWSSRKNDYVTPTEFKENVRRVFDEFNQGDFFNIIDKFTFRFFPRELSSKVAAVDPQKKYIMVNEGINIDNPLALRAVLKHEFSHVILRHLQRSIDVVIKLFKNKYGLVIDIDKDKDSVEIIKDYIYSHPEVFNVAMDMDVSNSAYSAEDKKALRDSLYIGTEQIHGIITEDTDFYKENPNLVFMSFEDVLEWLYNKYEELNNMNNLGKEEKNDGSRGNVGGNGAGNGNSGSSAGQSSGDKHIVISGKRIGDRFFSTTGKEYSIKS